MWKQYKEGDEHVFRSANKTDEKIEIGTLRIINKLTRRIQSCVNKIKHKSKAQT